MNVVILTQDDPFFLAENLDYLLSDLSPDVNVTGCVVFEASPFGGKESFLSKILKTWNIFGTGFLFNYGIRFLRNKLDPTKKVKTILERHSVPVIELDSSINSHESLEKIKFYEPDLLVSIAGNQIFKEELINLAPEGCLNLHTALLPKYRGLMPSFWVLKNNEDYTGVSVFFVDEGIDSGPILVQKKFEIGDQSQQELIQETKKLGMDAIIEAIDLVKKGEYKLIPNPDEKMTYYSFPKREDVEEFWQLGKEFY
ncbi:methionyl-tRNA formyltransferase [Fodinibius salinus]|uniref:Methionyl-tRNA formyltransferase n=1 Tax=Fodinibius salinus TaxID=860790 RepID=A0A5D3YNV5_9BACT|nr:formyltransferase family protein [Fodinibius salinus]TYP95620.1 methionyl-tRNA formyltransferase [Fodinibius salinus]